MSLTLSPRHQGEVTNSSIFKVILLIDRILLTLVCSAAICGTLCYSEPCNSVNCPSLYYIILVTYQAL